MSPMFPKTSCLKPINKLLCIIYSYSWVSLFLSFTQKDTKKDKLWFLPSKSSPTWKRACTYTEASRNNDRGDMNDYTPSRTEKSYHILLLPQVAGHIRFGERWSGTSEEEKGWTGLQSQGGTPGMGISRRNRTELGVKGPKERLSNYTGLQKGEVP